MAKRVILLSIDDLRFDALSCEQDTRYLDRFGLASMRETPTLDALAARGIRFLQAVSTSSYTPPAHATMLTGRFPPSHGMRAFLTGSLSESVPTLAESFARAGFHTVSAIDFGPMFALLGLDRGFEERFTTDDDALLAHLARRIDEPLFLFMHIGDVHPPVGESFDEPRAGYNEESYLELERLAAELGIPAEPLPRGDVDGRRRAAVALSNRVRMWAEQRGVPHTVELPRYLAGVNKFDQGRLSLLLTRFEEAGLLDDTLLVVVADHGQGTIPGARMGDSTIPAKFDHGETLGEETIRIPLIVTGPDVPSGRLTETQVSLADVAPTIADWAGIDPPEGTEGRSLLPLLQGAELEDSLAYAEVWFHDRLALGRYLKRCLAAGELLAEGYETFPCERAARTPQYKYVRRGSDLEPADWDLPDTEFVRTLFHRLVARVPERAVVAELAGALRDGVRTREQLVDDFVGRDANTEALYDLSVDPDETVNLLVLDASLRSLGREVGFRRVADELRERIDLIQTGFQPAVAAARADPGGMEVIESRLRDLGYVE